MSLNVQSLNVFTTVTARRPTLIRVWRTDGARLTSTWISTLAPTTHTPTEPGPQPGGQHGLPPPHAPKP